MFAAHLESIVEGQGGSVRRARREDGPALARLLEHAGGPGVAPQSGHVLVLDLDGLVVAAMHVDCDGSRAHVRYLVVDDALQTTARAVEERMLGVATAMCEAYGCRELDICASGWNDIALARRARTSRGRS